jgi:uroporphyrinogen III methyltransferase/synthase
VKVYLIGAGPGDPELITERGKRRLGEADLVLYDALVHPDLLAGCKAGAELEFVGKRAGRVSQRQAEINERMIAAARAGKVVARLKGGDPYLFGRGTEEAEACVEAGIPFEVVPGVPSPLAVAAYAGISLTHRELASSVALITATESEEKDASSHDWPKLATATQTLVIFMGTRRLPSLMKMLIAHGRDPFTPAAVIQWASLPGQKTVVGTVVDVARLAAEAGIGMPALTIVGDVVAQREHLRWFDRQPLFGKRVLVTRPKEQAAGLSRLLRDEAADAIEMAAIRIVEPSDGGAALRAAVAGIAKYGWVVFTSRNGVEAFFGEVGRQGGDARRLGGARVCAIGPATAEALVKFGVRADVVPEEFRGEAAAEAIIQAATAGQQNVRRAPGTLSVLLPRAEEAREVLPEMLREAWMTVDVVAAYRTVGPTGEDAERIAAAIRGPEIDVVTFTSSSTVHEVVKALGAGAVEALEGVAVASIGPITTETAQALGVRVDVTASDYTAAGLVTALREHFS